MDMLKLVAGHSYWFPKSLVVPCAWIKSHHSLSLRDAVQDVTHHEGGSTTRDQLPHITLESGVHFPNQPNRSPGSTVSDPLTYWWGVTLCPPELSDVALAESVVISTRKAAICEMITNSESWNLMALEWNARSNRRLIQTPRHMAAPMI